MAPGNQEDDNMELLTCMSLIDAAKDGDIQKVTELIASGADVDDRDGIGASALHWSTTNNHEKVVETLIDSGADVNARDENRTTLLHLAADEGNEVILRALLASGAAVQVKDKDGLTPLHWAADRGHTSFSLSLISAGADIHARAHSICGNSTPLHRAARNGRTER